MMSGSSIDFSALRDAMAGFDISSKVSPTDKIELERVFFPDGHRGVFDLRRQLIVGNRGAGKSFWTRALTNPEVREALAEAYALPALGKTEVVVGFNGSDKQLPGAATIDEIKEACKLRADFELIWKAVILRAARSWETPAFKETLAVTIDALKLDAGLYSTELSNIDDRAAFKDISLLFAFDALDRLGDDWKVIRGLTNGLLKVALGLQSFQRLRAKIFMRVDQFADEDIFRFQDSSKVRNDHVDLAWRSDELYGLLLFELIRHKSAATQLETLAEHLGARSALPRNGKPTGDIEGQKKLINAMAGEFMGKGPKRGRVYSWVPLHLSDAENRCSPRTFLTAWQAAAMHAPASKDLVMDYAGLQQGVQKASTARLNELKEDYWWIDLALNPLRGQHVPMAKADLFTLWRGNSVAQKIEAEAGKNHLLPPIGLSIDDPETLLRAMIRTAVMEERTNGKVNLPDIFRVDAGVMRKGGVAVPKRK